MDDFLKEARDRVKEAEKSVIYRAVIFIIAGLIMIIWPLKVADFVCFGIAIILALFGARFIVNYMKKDLVQDFFRYDLVFGIILIIMAIFFIAKSEAIMSMIPTVIGIIIIFNGVLKLQNAIDFARSNSKGFSNEVWKKILLAAVINIAIGVLLVVFPLGAVSIAYRLLGIGVLYSGISDIIIAVQFKNTVNTMSKKMSDTIRNTTIDGHGEFVDDDK